MPLSFSTRQSLHKYEMVSSTTNRLEQEVVEPFLKALVREPYKKPTKKYLKRGFVNSKSYVQNINNCYKIGDGEQR